jgi:hypothetical protein
MKKLSVVPLLVLACACSELGLPVGQDVAGSRFDTTTDTGTSRGSFEQRGESESVQVEETLDEWNFDIGTSDLSGPACEAGEGCFLDKCTENNQCQSGWCVEYMGEGVCTVPCQEECPDGWACKQIGGGGPDVVYVCVSEFSNLCKPCATTEGCKSAGGGEDVCLDYGTQGSFCGGPCDGAAQCPWGFSCVEAMTVEGVPLTQCVADSGICPCTGKSVALGLTTPCEADNDFGTCIGKRICAEEGLTDCDAAVAALEECNGLDDDCDGDVDEPALTQGAYVNLCDDGNSCTDDLCQGEQGCEYVVLSQGECADGDVCTVADHCENGTCVGLPVVCDDSDPCTDDFCDGLGGCTTEFNDADCDDSDPCTVNDKCKEGICDGFAVDCECQSDADCQPLEDSDMCNGVLHCDLTKLPYLCAVMAQTVVVCPQPPEGPDSICLAAACDPQTGECSLVPAHGGFACEDGDGCTVGDQCEAGLCLSGPPAVCMDDNPCTDDSCDPAAGCLFAPNQAPCFDGDLCTSADGCDGGVCQPGAPLHCDDGNPCTDDSCAPESGCVHEFNGGECDDGNACTIDDHCEAGLCVADQGLFCADDNICTTDSCHPQVGCVHTLNNAPCDDGNVCTTGDHCQLGDCTSSGNLTCNDGNSCTKDGCSMESGCTFAPLSGGQCDDGSVCTLGDTCQGGWCQPGAAIECLDGNPCTDDECDPVAGCHYPSNADTCDDGNDCTFGDTCGGGQCLGGPLVECDDGDPCTDDVCAADGGCTYGFNTAKCDDDDACTLDDGCVNGACLPGTPILCDDGNICTDDTCDPALGCFFAANGGPCDDGNACTEGDSCSMSACQPGAVPLDCGDGNDCTQDSCDEQNGCVHIPVVDGMPCAGDSGTCNGGNCVLDIVDSCATILANAPASPDGVYTIDPDGDGGEQPFDVFCEMDLDAGGWTLVMSINTADGQMSYLPHQIWTTTQESGNFANRWSNDYRSRAMAVVEGTSLLVIVRSHTAVEGAQPQGWRSWNINGKKAFHDFFTVPMGAETANATGGCNNGFSGDGHKMTAGIRTAGITAPWDTFTSQGEEIYTNSYYGSCGNNQDGFRLSTHYRWANNSNVGLGLQMDGTSSSYNLEAGALLKKETYTDPQRQCCNCGSCTAHLDGSISSSAASKAAIGTDHNNCHCSVGVSYRYEWYVR